MKHTSSSLIKYDCKKAYDLGVKGSIKDDLIKKGYNIVNFEFLNYLSCAIIEIKIMKIEHPDYIIELQPLWNFNK